MQDLYALAFGQGLEVDLVEVLNGFLLIRPFQNVFDIILIDEVRHADEELPVPLVTGNLHNLLEVIVVFHIVYPPEAFEFTDYEIQLHLLIMHFDTVSTCVQGLGAGGEMLAVWVTLAFDGEVVTGGYEEEGRFGSGSVEFFIGFCEVESGHMH